MRYFDALKLIENEYKISKLNDKSVEVITGKQLNPFNLAFISLIDRGDDCVLSDMATTIEIVDIDENKLKEIAESEGLIFDDCYVKTKFTSLDDINKFLKFFDKVSNF